MNEYKTMIVINDKLDAIIEAASQATASIGASNLSFMQRKIMEEYRRKLTSHKDPTNEKIH